MCGIAGILGIQDISLGKKVIKNMTDAIAHRGPDAEGHFVAEKVALGHRRLSIIDLSEAANQPFIDHSGRYQVIFNGEMYNFQEVKDRLPDYPYRTNGDTEVLLAAYEKWGKDCLQYFNGMFAFALWDTQTQELWVVRDRLGIKPFYYYLDNQHFIFASEIRAILASGLVAKQLNATALMDYLTYYSVNAPQTLIQGVVQLMPGEYAVYQNGKLQKTTYWKIENNYVGKIEPNETQIKQKVKDLMQASIQRRMVSDVPLGAFLSGGIDSSAVVALMAEGSSQPVNTFSIVFNEKDYDESDYSNLIAKKYHTKHTPLLLRPTDFLKELPAALNAMDNPSGDGINTYVVSKATKQAGVTVALSGLGGDELFAGYPVFQQWHKLAKYRSFWGVPQFLRKGVGVMAAALKNDRQSARLAELISVKNANFANVYPTFRKLMVAEELTQLTKGLPIDYNSVHELLAERENALQKLPLLSQVSVGELLSYTLNVLIKDTDQMSMASALEVREPFFDYELVQYVMQIPDAIKFPKYSKSLLVEALSPRLPDEIVHRKKMGFVFPWEHWMRNELKDLCTQRLTKLAQHRFFQQSELLSRWQRFLQKDPKITWVPLWSMVVLADWMEKNGVE